MDTVNSMGFYSVRAETDDGALITFGLEAGSYDDARIKAMDRLPHYGAWTMELSEIIRPEQRGDQE